MKVKELIEKLKELDQEKDIEFKYYYNNLKDCNTYYTEGEIEEILNKVYLKIDQKKENSENVYKTLNIKTEYSRK